MPPDDDVGRQIADARLLGAIDERTRNIEKKLDEMASSMVTKGAFTPVRLIAFGLVTLVMVAVVIALLAQVLPTTPGLPRVPARSSVP